MADFRKSLLLAAMALAVGVGTASAQQPTCSSTGTAISPPTLRAEGQEELTGAIVLTCSNLPAESVNLAINLNGGFASISSRNGGAEAMVSVNGGTPVTGTLVTVGSTTKNNELTFNGVAIPAGSSTIQISGIRVDATTVSQTAGFGPVLATIQVSNGVLGITQSGGFLEGVVIPGFGSVGATSPITNLNSCATVVSLPAGVDFTATVSEAFATAFKAQTGPPNTDSETGPVVGATPANTGTQFAVTFGNIPSGLSFYIPVSITSLVAATGHQAYGSTFTPSQPTLAQLVTGAGSTTVVTSGISIIGGVSYVQVTAGSTVWYNVENADPVDVESWQIPIYSPGGAVPSGAFTSGNPTTVTIALAPNATVDVDAPVFLTGKGSGIANLTLGTQNTCQTSLLFPFLTNQAGFDTGISIAATGTDPFGTGVGGGVCTIYLYADSTGSAAPGTPPTLTIPAGGENHTTISAIDPGFQGYGIAECLFTYAHGFAFITDGFGGAGRGLSEGYIPLVLTDATRNGASTSPETLSQ